MFSFVHVAVEFASAVSLQKVEDCSIFRLHMKLIEAGWYVHSAVRAQKKKMATSSASSSSLTMAELAAMAGAGTEVVEYLDARGIKAVATLALLAANETAAENFLVRPLLDGFKKGSVQISLSDEEKPIAQAVLLHMWAEARMWWTARQATGLVIPAQPGASPVPSPVVAPGLSSDKVPKTLPPQVWNQQITRYNSITLGGRPRKFPEQELLGAESILARIHHEHVVTRQYSPVQLGEILAKRSFQASGEINPLAKSPKKSNYLTIEDNLVVQEDEKVWQPRSILAVMDGVNSIRWAYILLQLGEEDQIHAWCDWCIAKARARPNKLEQLKAYWEAASWRICMGMRAGKTFGESSAAVMNDVDLFCDYMSKDAPKEPGNPRPPLKRKAQQGADDDNARPNHRPRHTAANDRPRGKGDSKGRVDRDYRGWQSNSWSSTPRWKQWPEHRQAPREGQESKDSTTR